jgi:CDP-glucose 4,6-dehydratase
VFYSSGKNFWDNKKVFITGHTGFKGSWLCLLLNELGAKVTGYSLPPDSKKIIFNQNARSKICIVLSFALHLFTFQMPILELYVKLF